MARFVLLTAALVVLPTFATAQQPLPTPLSPTIALTGIAGFGGTTNTSGTAWENGDSTDVDESSDLATTYGAGLQFDAPIHRNFSLGVIGRMSWWRGDGGTKRAMSGDALAAARIRHAISLDGPNEWCVIFAQISGGAGFTQFPDPDKVETQGLKYTLHTGASPLLGADVGAQFLLGRDFGLTFLIGVLHREMPLNLSAHNATDRVSLDATISATQFVAGTGIVVVL